MPPGDVDMEKRVGSLEQTTAVNCVEIGMLKGTVEKLADGVGAINETLVAIRTDLSHEKGERDGRNRIVDAGIGALLTVLGGLVIYAVTV